MCSLTATLTKYSFVFKEWDMVYAVVFTPVMQGIGYCLVHAQRKSIIINKRD